MTDRSPIDELRADHAALTAAMQTVADCLARLSDAAATPWAGAGDELLAKVEDLRGLLLLHFRREEEALFPEVIAMISQGAPRVDILSQFFSGEADDDLTAHTIIRSRIRELCEAMTEAHRAADIKPDGVRGMRTTVNLAADILRRHMEKEHTIIFPMIERMLDEAQMTKVGQGMGRIRPTV